MVLYVTGELYYSLHIINVITVGIFTDEDIFPLWISCLYLYGNTLETTVYASLRKSTQSMKENFH